MPVLSRLACCRKLFPAKTNIFFKEKSEIMEERAHHVVLSFDGVCAAKIRR